MRFRVLIALVLASLIPITTRAQWQENGTPVSTAVDNQYTAAIVSDEAGGAIVTWMDVRSGSNYDIYAQRIDASGTPLWTADGVALCTDGNDQYSPIIISDGAGGAIVTWQDYRNGNADIFVQRIDASGAPLWTADGVAVCTESTDQSFPVLTSDGAGGAIVTWYDARNGNADIFVQRIDGSGSPTWTMDGVGLCLSSGDQMDPQITTDGAGGAIVTWYDTRNSNNDIFARRIDASGTPQWTADGVALCLAFSDQSGPQITTDGAGGAIVTWHDFRYGTAYDIYAQRIDASGNPKWTSDGVALCYADDAQYAPQITTDGAGGAIVTWEDYRNGFDIDIYARRINASGDIQWKADGVPVCTAVNDQQYPSITSDGAGGAIVAWFDFRNGIDNDIYVQRITSAGTFPWWTPDGVALCTANDEQFLPRIISDDAGGAIVAWYDERNGIYDYDIFAQRVGVRYGYWGRPEPTLTNAYDNPNDQGGKIVLNWTASGRDVLNQAVISRYSIWRAVDEISPQSFASEGVVLLDAPVTAGVSPGTRVIWHDPSAAADYYWELVGSQDANYRAGYSFTAPTRQDSTSGSTATQYFQIVAESYSQFINWPSNVLSSHSVDNLAPSAPLMLMAQRVGPDVHLQWSRVNAPDFRDYAVYRSDVSGVTPVPANFLASDLDTMMVDAGAPTTSLYYIVTAYDVHENQSPPSREAAVSTVTDVGGLPPITALRVLPNHPNPFTTATEVEVGLPAAGPIRVEVYDVKGRRVRTLEVAGVEGWQRVYLSGATDRGELLSSGVYLYRVTADGTTLTRKMLITR